MHKATLEQMGIVWVRGERMAGWQVGFGLLTCFFLLRCSGGVSGEWFSKFSVDKIFILRAQCQFK